MLRYINWGEHPLTIVRLNNLTASLDCECRVSLFVTWDIDSLLFVFYAAEEIALVHSRECIGVVADLRDHRMRLSLLVSWNLKLCFKPDNALINYFYPSLMIFIMIFFNFLNALLKLDQLSELLSRYRNKLLLGVRWMIFTDLDIDR